MHLTQLYIPDETTFSIPFKFVDVVRQTRKSTDNAFERTLKDYWNDDGKKSCSQRNGLEHMVSEWQGLSSQKDTIGELSTHSSPTYYTT